MPTRGGAASGRRDVDFAAIARDLLGRADQLVPQWLPAGKREGHEWKVGNLRGDSGRSLSINLVTGQWGDFAAGEVGGDLLALYAAMHGCRMIDAARQLGFVRDDDRGSAAPPPAISHTRPEPAKPKSEWVPIVPVPEAAPDYRRALSHRYRNELPTASWEYRSIDGALLNVICRYATSAGGKEIRPLSWCQNAAGELKWHGVHLPEPRPLYGLPRLAGDAAPCVILVEGEKCADALHELLAGARPVLTWPGGANGTKKADFSPLAGRKVILWPDHDRKADKAGALMPAHAQPGIKAMEAIAEQLLELGCEVTILDLEPLGERADGWDVADAIAEGWTRERVVEYLAAHQRAPKASAPTRAARAGEGGGGEVVAAGCAGPPGLPDSDLYPLVWRGRDLVPCTANVHSLLMRAPAWRGVIAFDEFAQRIVKLQAPPYGGEERIGEWESTDDTRTAMWLAVAQGFTPSSALVAETVEVIARENAFHPVRTYLEGLTWDGTTRIDDWLSDFLGVVGTDYTRLVARFFLIGMVKRVMEPGCKFDYCLVLEGQQGIYKSSALRVLGGGWFKDTDLDLQQKDAMTALQGAWLYEIAELDSLSRAESSKQKSFLSRQVDEFRPVYGRREIRLPRQVVFAGTTNQWEWLRDPTGGRRFWPIEVTEVNLMGLAAVRDQLFAEASVEYRKGSPCYPDRDQQRTLFDPQQLARQQSEGYVDALHDWVYSRTADFSLAEAAADGLKIDYSKLTRDVQTRVGNALKALGCTRVERRNGMVRFWYRPPTRKAASSELTHAQQESGGDRDPLPI
ncbi:MAG: hypothetical protein RJA99_4281 [Pseudomonadota bacterium]|jgi:predicted P-loop ATPase